MARGRWNDFTSNAGFSDGDLSEPRDFKVRDLLVKKLNRLLKTHIAISYDRPGMHNCCFILIYERREGWPVKRYLEGDESGFVKDVDLRRTDFPEDKNIQEMIDETYEEVNNPSLDPKHYINEAILDKAEALDFLRGLKSLSEKANERYQDPCSSDTQKAINQGAVIAYDYCITSLRTRFRISDLEIDSVETL
jgi:hypothetical protein